LLSKPSDSEVLVSCQGISKKFCRNLKKSLWYGVKDGVSEIVRGQSSDTLRKDEFWALNDVTFELRRGECLGLLGRNGAGKTTLLKVLSGLIKPDKGTITLKGKVGGLIALGAGFNGILSGRENIRINGSILGYSRAEIEERMQEIIDFAEIPDFIDAPVQTYSSGMSVRLGFAIAAILTKPDVLLLDEVLAVGDIGFTIKCLNAVREMMKDSAVIFVSHNMQFVSQFCTQVIVFEKGQNLGQLKTSDGIQKYLNTFPPKEIQVRSDKVIIKEMKLIDDNEETLQNWSERFLVNHGTKIFVSFNLSSEERISGKFGVEIQDAFKQPIISFSIEELQIDCGISNVKIPLKKIKLNSGNYSIAMGFVEKETKKVLVRLENICPFYVKNKEALWGKILIYTSLEVKKTQR
jgi:lipopolysaccharide transport system ATP-binding protein